MAKRDIEKIIAEMQVKRNAIFISISSKDKDYAVRLIEMIENMDLNLWCMYRQNGRDSNISGDEYRKVINSRLAESCVFLMLLSKHSMESMEVKNELVTFLDVHASERDSVVKIIPVYLGDLKKEDIPEDFARLSGITPQVIARTFDENTTDEELRVICEEIRKQYISVLFKNIKMQYEGRINSLKFVNLMDECIKNKCSLLPISEDIKNSSEISADKLKELHVISNEMIEYDCNTYSCMVIASNLMGNLEISNKKKYYQPEKNGVKYFYYYPERLEADKTVTFEKILSFVRKDDDSRRDVVQLIRKEFCQRNRLKSYFSTFNGKTVEDFIEKYHVAEHEDARAFDELFEEDQTQYYFEFSNTDDNDVFQVPDEFFAWMNGSDDRFSYDAKIEVADDFIAFLGKFDKFLSEAKNVNRVAYEALHMRYIYLTRLKLIEDWQARKVKITNAEAKRLVNYLLDHTVDSLSKTDKKFPRLATWMDFERDENGEIVPVSEGVIQAAMKNLVAIPLKENDYVKLCYSFALFINSSSSNGAWYSTGNREVEGVSEGMVMTCNIEKQAEEYDRLLDAFKYLLEVYPEAKQIFKDNKSEIFKLI